MTARVLVIVMASIVVTSAASAAQTAPAPPSPEQPASIRGRVTAADTGRPLRRARITLRSLSETAGNAPIVANSNVAGHFELKNVPPGGYIVHVARAGYEGSQYGQRRPGDRGMTIDVAAGQAVTGIDVVLARAAVLSGRVFDDLGEPYAGVRVDALTTRYLRGQRVPSPASVATTDDLGNYRFSGLPPGRYYVVASSTETWKTAKNETHGYASTYFPAGGLDTAQLITLGPSEHRTDLNITLSSSRAARISGRVLRENGEPSPAAGVQLSYSYPGAIMVAGSRTVRTGGDGSFEFKDVPGGVYMVGGGSADQIVTVAGADIDSIVLVPKTGSVVTGTMVTDDGVAPPFASSGVRVTLTAPFAKVLPTVYVNAVDPNWSFKLTNLGGPFMFRVAGLPPEWTLTSVRLNDKDITDVPWDVPTGGKEIAGLQIVVSRRVGRISGSVLDGRGKPSSAATILVFSEDSDHWIPGSRLVKTARPAADGAFTLRDLPAGTYRALARDYVEEGQWEDPKFLESVRDAGVRVVLADGGTESVTLKLPAAR
jgi:protocatechuate 3,4-dioxygenase beta subunit